ncbi:unnamed protein product [Gadus morhua 'NCC']
MCGFPPTEEALPSDELCVVHLQEGLNCCSALDSTELQPPRLQSEALDRDGGRLSVPNHPAILHPAAAAILQSTPGSGKTARVTWKIFHVVCK